MIVKIKRLLIGWGSIYNFSPKICNPYMDENNEIKSTEQSLYEHWQAVGGYMQSAMSNFDDGQKKQKQANI